MKIRQKNNLLESGDYYILYWQGRQDLNPQPMDLESTTLPIEPRPFIGNI